MTYGSQLLFIVSEGFSRFGFHNLLLICHFYRQNFLIQVWFMWVFLCAVCSCLYTQYLPKFDFSASCCFAWILYSFLYVVLRPRFLWCFSVSDHCRNFGFLFDCFQCVNLMVLCLNVENFWGFIFLVFMP